MTPDGRLTARDQNDVYLLRQAYCPVTPHTLLLNWRIDARLGHLPPKEPQLNARPTLVDECGFALMGDQEFTPETIFTWIAEQAKPTPKDVIR